MATGGLPHPGVAVAEGDLVAERDDGDHVTILDSQTATAAPNTVGVWTTGARTVISERSSAGGRFYVELDNGKITKENVRGLAFVF